MNTQTIATMIARKCAKHGVRRVFGMPGGGSALDLIEAFEQNGIQFVLCRAETPAVFMAAADAECKQSFGVAITTQGPGLASATNGLAYSALDRAPVLLLSDTWAAGQLAFDTHQVIDQKAITAPLVKGHSRLETEDPQAELDSLIEKMLQAPWGPAYIELSGPNARREIPMSDIEESVHGLRAAHDVSVTQGDAAAALKNARRPVILVGLEARIDGAREQILRMAEQLRCPVLTTYKAKGIVSDESEWLVGHFTGGSAESPTISAADLIILCGLDPVELIGKPWPYKAPVLDLALMKHPVHYVEPIASTYGPLPETLRNLLTSCPRSDWSGDEIQSLRSQMQARLAYQGKGHDLSPQVVVQEALACAGESRPAITVDAGAHMFSAMAFWKTISPTSALISDGISTMGFSLPAGIAMALNTPERPTIVFTGDGGLKMSLAELATAAQYKARLCVVVFNDGALSLIALKQVNRGMEPAGVTWARADFKSIAIGLGLKAFTATSLSEYRAALKEALVEDGPCLIDVHIDNSGYREQAAALRN